MIHDFMTVKRNAIGKMKNRHSNTFEKVDGEKDSDGFESVARFLVSKDFTSDMLKPIIHFL